MIKVTYLDIKKAESAMGKVTINPSDVKSAYWVSRLIKKLDIEAATFDKEKRKLIDLYGVKDDKTGRIQVPPDGMAKFEEEIEKVLLTEVEIDMPQIKYDYIKNIKLSAGDLLVLEKFVEDIAAALKTIEIKDAEAKAAIPDTTQK